MIFKGSRYEKTPALKLTKPSGEVIAYLGVRFIPPTPAGYYHTVQSHERLDLLAFQFYRNPEKFWRIADANQAMDAEDLLEPGAMLKIPPDRT